ncbi:helix-turn-helix domain-containing protein [Paraburkholderia unamae]|uniref:Helix-turn-helix domain-containing protein n=1 Tax=Paraburkholderia unamae TaxID=219649 RepID=A0ACC6RXH9_9BURK
MNSNFEERTEQSAEDAFQNAFADINWQVSSTHSDHHGDLIITAPDGHVYFAMLKFSTEGRPDRVTALFAQALLEARVVARQHHGRPAALIWVKTASPSLIKRLRDFHDQYAEGEAYGLISGDGLKYLHFPGVPHELATPITQVNRRTSRGSSQTHLVFSDRTQWMLKLLLAPEIPEPLLTARREQYRTATDLARAAGVSAMTASRFVNALTEKGFLDQSSPYLKLVMRRKLADLWKASYKNQPDPVAVKFLVQGPPAVLMEKLLQKHQHSFLGLFAAAEVLAVGHVRGVPPYVYVYDLDAANHWKELKAAQYGEKPDLLLQRIRFPQSIGAGAVQRKGMYVTDILQVWLDVSAHPARGAEQAAELERGILANVIGEGA